MTQKQYRDICITSFNTEIDWFKDWSKQPKNIITYMIIQGELCKEGKQHIQGFIQFNGQKRMEQIKKFFGDNTLHIEKRFGSVEQARDYCKQEKNGVWHQYEEYGEIDLTRGQGKRTDISNIIEQIKEGQTLNKIIMNSENDSEKTVALQYYRPLKIIEKEIKQEQAKGTLIKDYEGVQWKQWQQDILDQLDNIPNNRIINWVYDRDGNNGKSYLSKYLQLSRATYYITGGKQQDILYGYDDEEIIIYDLARTYADNMEHIYTTIENFKNGMYLSTKYETRQRIFKIPHIYIMANFKPDITKLSQDRWNIIDLTQDTQVTNTITNQPNRSPTIRKDLYKLDLQEQLIEQNAKIKQHKEERIYSIEQMIEIAKNPIKCTINGCNFRTDGIQWLNKHIKFIHHNGKDL